jgi:hypothetical protein
VRKVSFRPGSVLHSFYCTRFDRATERSYIIFFMTLLGIYFVKCFSAINVGLRLNLKIAVLSK